MKALKIILAIIGSIIAVFLGVAAFLPSSPVITETKLYEDPVSEVYPMVHFGTVQRVEYKKSIGENPMLFPVKEFKSIDSKLLEKIKYEFADKETKKFIKFNIKAKDLDEVLTDTWKFTQSVRGTEVTREIDLSAVVGEKFSYPFGVYGRILFISPFKVIMQDQFDSYEKTLKDNKIKRANYHSGSEISSCNTKKSCAVCDKH